MVSIRLPPAVALLQHMSNPLKVTQRCHARLLTLCRKLPTQQGRDSQAKARLGACAAAITSRTHAKALPKIRGWSAACAVPHSAGRNAETMNVHETYIQSAIRVSQRLSAGHSGQELPRTKPATGLLVNKWLQRDARRPPPSEES